MWISTRRASPPVPFRDALLTGLAPDGGLYVPERLDPMTPGAIESVRGRSVADVGVAIAAHLVGDEIPSAELERLIPAALNFSIPLVKVGPWHALELFHGPTFAFKDVGARVMARLMSHVAGSNDRFTVLVATSGDTGSAVAHAFAGLAGTRVVVLYPEGQVSDVQEAQFATLGGNVQAVAVQGTFDDCQALVKAAFGDAALRERAQLTSANSINVGRLLPQIFYYAWAALNFRGVVFSVPSGNFGNLTAGLIAKRLGFPIAHFIAATNVNDVVPEYLASGRYQPRASVRTLANAMDVGAPSNFERMRALYDDDVERLREDVTGLAFDDARVKSSITEVFARYGYILDPHSAIAWLAANSAIRDPQSAVGDPHPGARVFLATAHPAKFRETVEPAIGRRVKLPNALREAMKRPRRSIRMRAKVSELAEVLR